MKRKIDYVFTIIIVLLGFVHISLTPLFYPSIDEAADIFIGMGLAFIFLGVLNITRLLSNHKRVTVLCSICNCLAIGYLIFFCITVHKIEPQLIIMEITLLVPTAIAFMESVQKRKLVCN